ncbi:MAG: hypothetical protein Q7K03_11670 [Dehalococcoidia bacterium]|nr:hypothetical protein [Dehalococcoidia bacterium]
MNTNSPRNRRVGLAILATVAVIAVIVLVPGIALGLTSNFDTTKDVYKVGEDVIGNGSILFNGTSQEVAKIASAKIKVQPKPGSSKPGSEFFDVFLPLTIGNHDLTNDPAFAGLKARGSTLEVTVTWTDLGPAVGGYALGYKGTSINAKIDFVIRWKPPIKRAGEVAGLTPLNAPVKAFDNPGGFVGAGGDLAASELFEIPGFEPLAPEGATVLGLAFDRYSGTLLALMNNPTPGGNDTILVIHPTLGYILDAIDTGTPDAQDVAWLGDSFAATSKFTAMPGSVWVAIQSGGSKSLKMVAPSAGTDTPITVVDSLPLKGLGALSYDDPFGNQHLLPAFFQASPDVGIPVHQVRPDTGADESIMVVPAGPTGGGYNDVEVNDAKTGFPPSGLGAFGNKVGEFDIPSGFFLGSKNVVSGGDPLANIVGLAMDSAGTLYLANQESKGKIYSVSLSGGGGGCPPACGGPVGQFARAITNDPTNIFLLMDNTGTGGKDQIVRTDGAGVEVNKYNAPGSEHEGLALLGSFLYTVDNGSMPLKLYKLAPATGAVQSGYPKPLPPLVEQLGDLTVNAAGNKLIGVGRFSDKLYEIDPANGGVTSTKTMIAMPPAFSPFGMEGLTLVTGAPGSPFLLGAKGTGFFFINIDTGSIFEFKPISVFPPFNLTGLTQRGSDILMTDDSQQVFRASLPGAAKPDDTVAGDYESIFTVTLDPSGGSPPAVTAPFSIERVTTLEVTITDPKDGTSFTSTPITIKGLVNDPTVKKVTLGIDLPTTNLLGPAGFESGIEGYTTTDMWHRTNDFGGKPARAIGSYSLAYTRDTINQGSLPPGQIYTYQTQDSGTGQDTANSGTATSAKFSVGSGTMLNLKTWYDTEPNFFGPFGGFGGGGGGGGPQFDNKFIKVLTYNDAGAVTATATLAQIVSFPPSTTSGPPTFSQPGTVFTDSGFAAWKLVFIPPAMFDPFTGKPILTKVELGMDAFLGKKVAVQFAYDTVDPFGNNLEGWVVDVVGVTGAGSAGDQFIDVVNGAYSGSFALATGDNKIKVTATRDAYDPQSASKTVTVSLDISNPILRLLLSEDVNGNLTKDTGVGIDLDGDGIVDITVDEDMDGNSAITKLAGGVEPLVTKTASQTVFGVFQENNPVLLTVELNGKLVLSLKEANLNPAKPTFSASITLVSGLNTIEVNMKDAGGLEPNPAAKDVSNNPINKLSVQVILDNKGPSLAALGTIYPFTALEGKEGDPVVYQVNASDAETGIATVEIITQTSPAVITKNMIASANTPQVLRDQWGTAGNYLFPTILPLGSGAKPAASFTLTVNATDNAGNVTTGVVVAQVNTQMTAWNACLQRNGNLFGTPIQPTNGSLATLLNQKVKNVSAAFKATLSPLGDGSGDLSLKLDADGDVTLRNVINTIQYWPGGVAGAATFKVYTPDPSADTLTTLEEGKGYWAFTKPGAFKSAEGSFSCMNLTIAGQFLADGAVPPTFSEKAGWNAVAAHTENDLTVIKFLKGLSPESQAAATLSSSLLAFKNGVEFDYANTGNKDINGRVTQKLGVFETRFENDKVVLRGEGFWLFLLADGLLVP